MSSPNRQTSKRVLVTGGGGFLGLAMVRSLLANGFKVSSFSRSHYALLEDLGVDQLTGDLADSEAVSRAVLGQDRVFHVAALAGAWGPWRNYFKTNIQGTRNVLDACLEHGVQELVYTSTPSVVFTGEDMEGVDESTPYASHFEAHYPRSKAVAECAVLEANCRVLKTAALRPHLIWGPGDSSLTPRILERAASGRLRKIGGDQHKIAPTFIDDAVRAHLGVADALEKAKTSRVPPCGRAYFVTSGETIPVWEMIDRILKAAGRPALNKKAPRWLALAAGTGLEAVYTLLGRNDEPPLTRWIVRELASSHWFNLDRSKDEFGYQPSVSIDDGMLQLAESLTHPSRKVV